MDSHEGGSDLIDLSGYLLANGKTRTDEISFKNVSVFDSVVAFKRIGPVAILKRFRRCFLHISLVRYISLVRIQAPD
ncbi:MAG: hypothetical protein CL726_07065 [Chloroflexi bacterium]|nr:hypothetical protein [Chloroflexota bacterium]